MKLRRFMIVGIALVTVLVVGMMMVSRDATAAWSDINYLYRQNLSITNASGSTQTDFQVLITLDSATLITAGKMLSTCNDIKITDLNGKVMPYWIEPTTCNTSTTKIWVKVSSIPTTGAKLYIYYGNASATATSSSSKTFIREIADVHGAWKHDESGTGTRADSSGDTNTLTNNNSVTNGTGQFNNASAFTAASSMYLNVANNSNLSVTGTSFTVATWVNFTSLTAGTRPQLINKDRNTSGTREYTLYYDVNNNQFTFQAFDNGNGTNIITASKATTATTGTWYYVVATYDATSHVTNLYVNNSTPQTASSGNVTPINTTADFELGRPSFASFLDGRLDDTRFYKRALSAAEISDLYGTGSDREGYVTSNYPNKELVRKFNASVTVGSAATEEIGPGPVAYWKFDEGVSTTAKDSTADSNSLTLTNGPVWQPENMCVAGKCLFFDGTNDTTIISDASQKNLDMGTRDWTISAWIRTNNSANQDIVNKNDSGSGPGYLLGIRSTGKITAFFANGTTTFSATSTNTVHDNKWHHIMAVYRRSSTLQVYIDGVPDGAATTISSISGSSIDATSRFNIGSDSNTATVFKGYIDEVKVYPYARSTSQILQDYNAGKSTLGAVQGTSTSVGNNYTSGSNSLAHGLVAYWKMDETSWTNDCSTGTALDSSGIGNNLTSCPSTTGPTGGTAGKYGLGGTFDGVDDTLKAASTSVGAPANALTASIWYKGTTQSNVPRFISHNSTQNVGFDIEVFGSTGIVQADVAPGGNQTSASYSTSTLDGNWHHAVSTWDGTRLRLYIDGVLRSSTATSTGSITYTTVLSLGANNNGTQQFFTGSLDEARIYNRALSDSEVAALYDWGPAPQAYWNLNEHTGTSANDTAGNTTGTLTNGPTWTQGKIGTAVNFDGVDDYIDTGSQYNFSSVDSFSVGAWVKTTTSTTASVVSKGCGFTGTYSLWVDGATNGPTFCIHDGSGTQVKATSSVNISDGRWHYIMGERDKINNVVTIYIDGIQRASTSDTTTGSFNRSNNVFIGKRPVSDAEFYAGAVDDVKIYNYPRSIKQMAVDMNASKTVVSNPTQAVIGYWKFDEGTGTTANNSGNGGSTLNGTLTNMASPATSTSGWSRAGKFATALAFDGSNDYVTVPNNTALNPGTGGFTISAWEKSSNVAASIMEIMRKDQAAATIPSYALRIDASHHAHFFTNNGTTTYQIAGTVDLNDGAWHHVAGVRDTANSLLRLYVDGKQVGTAAETVFNLAPTGPLDIGRDTNVGEQFNGSIDEAKYYNYALSADEVRTDYNRGLATNVGALSTASNGTTADNSTDREACIPGDTSTCTSPIGEWKLDEGTGTSASDTSGNAFTGTWTGTGTTHWIQGKVGKAGKFNGTDDYINTSNNSSFNGTSTTLTAEAWVKRTDSASTDVFYLSKGGGGAGGWALDYNTNNQLVVVYKNGASNAFTVSSTVNLSRNIWYHVAVVMTIDTVTSGNNTAKIYINGVDRTGTPTNSSAPTTSTATLKIGARGEDASVANFFPGQLDQVKIYNYTRTPAQIVWDYNKGAPLALWRMDDCSGTSLNDSSGNNNTMTATIGGTGTQTSVGDCFTSSTAWGNAASGKFSSAMNFDGTDDYAVSAASLDLSSTNAITVSFWLNWTTFANDDKLAMEFSTNFNNVTTGFLVDPNSTNPNGKFSVGLKGDVGFNMSDFTRPSAGAWHHYVIVMDKSQAAATEVVPYVDGVAVAYTKSNSNNNTNNFGNQNLYFMSRNGASLFGNGMLDDVRIYNYALNATQVKSVMNQGMSANYY